MSHNSSSVAILGLTVALAACTGSIGASQTEGDSDSTATTTMTTATRRATATTILPTVRIPVCRCRGIRRASTSRFRVIGRCSRRPRRAFGASRPCNTKTACVPYSHRPRFRRPAWHDETVGFEPREKAFGWIADRRPRSPRESERRQERQSHGDRGAGQEVASRRRAFRLTGHGSLVPRRQMVSSRFRARPPAG